MLLQSLVLLAAMLVITATILTSTIVSAKNGLHQALLAKTQTAMNASIADFQAWAAAKVADKSAQTPWPKRFTTEFKSMCPSRGATSNGQCTYWSYTKWLVTGATTAGGMASTAATTQDAQVKNLATTVDEQRISATITVDIDDPSGQRTFASATRQVTARIFDAKPYVVVTGSRDVATGSGDLKTSEGDSGGVSAEEFLIHKYPRPEKMNPSSYVDTRIVTSIDCVNSLTAASQSDPYIDLGTSLNRSIRKYGNQDWAYEVPCAPNYYVAAPSDLKGYIAPVAGTYATVQDSPYLEHWSKGESKKAFRY